MVGPDPKPAGIRAEGVSDDDREEAPRYERPITFLPGSFQYLDHGGVVAGPQLREQLVPLGDHGVRGRSDHEVDAFIGKLGKATCVARNETYDPVRHLGHGPWDRGDR